MLIRHFGSIVITFMTICVFMLNTFYAHKSFNVIQTTTLLKFHCYNQELTF